MTEARDPMRTVERILVEDSDSEWVGTYARTLDELFMRRVNKVRYLLIKYYMHVRETE